MFPFDDVIMCYSEAYLVRQLWFHDRASRNNLLKNDYSQTSNMRRTLVGNKIVDHSDVVGALPVGTAPTTSSFST